MKEETYLFNDGTEPTVRRLPKGCDQQGRYPEAAEAATEVGQDESNFYGLEFWDAPESLGKLVLLGLCVVVLVGVLAFLVGVLV
jgi:hypothetical protein